MGVNTTSGAVYIKNQLDFETKPTVRMTVAAYDTSTISPNKGQTTVVVTVTDYNDNAPKFTNLPVQVTVDENRIVSNLYQLQVSYSGYATLQYLLVLQLVASIG